MTEISRFFLLSLTVAYTYLRNDFICLWDKTIMCSALGLPYWPILDLIIRTIFNEAFLNILILNQCPFIFFLLWANVFHKPIYLKSHQKHIYVYIYIYTHIHVYILNLEVTMHNFPGVTFGSGKYWKMIFLYWSCNFAFRASIKTLRSSCKKQGWGGPNVHHLVVV